MKTQTKTVSERVSALVMAGVMASTLAMPAMAFAADPSAGGQTGKGVTDMTMIQEIDKDKEYGGNTDPDNPKPNTDDPDTTPGKNLSFTVPSQINFVLSADGTLTGPTVAAGSYIENRSVMPIHASSLQVKKESGWNIVADATAAGAAANSVDLTMNPVGGTSFNLSTFVSDSAKKALDTPSDWNMTATDGVNENGGATTPGTDTKGFTMSGHASHIDKDITSATKFGEVHWFMQASQA